MPRPNRPGRRFRRWRVHLLVDYTADGRRSSSYATTLSAGGLFIESAAPLPVDSKLRLRFRLAHDRPLVDTEGRVSWVNDPASPADEQLPPGMGVEFTQRLEIAALAAALSDTD